MARNECDHERIKTGTAKQLKEALKRHTATRYLPWLQHKRACEGRTAPQPVQPDEIHDGAFDNEEER
jgi:hypothetical protein